MKRIIDFICNENKHSKRYNELVHYLKGKNYPNYIETLNDMLKDPKTRALIDDGFGGKLGNVQLKCSEKIIPTRKLLPTQNEIGVNESLHYGFAHPDRLDMYFSKKPIVIKHPIIVFNGSYIIDGHHRWSQMLCFHPDSELVCLNYEGNMSPIQMLKATQGAIAASLGELPEADRKGINLFDCTEEDIQKYIDENISDEFVTEFTRLNKDLKTQRDVEDYIIDNCMELKNDYPPIKLAPSRTLMPQTSKAGEVSEPGSALHRMKKDKVLKI